MADMIRLEGVKGYTVLQNEMILDSRLTLKTKGLMAVILSRPANWDYSVTGLAAFCRISRDTVRKCLVELEDAGYLTREQSHDDGGRFGRNIYTIREASGLPDLPPDAGGAATVDEKTVNGKNRQREKPLTENSPQRNKDLKKEGLKESPPISPPGGKRGGRNKQHEPAYQPEWFARFWAKYPRKVNKLGAVKAWNRLRPSLELCRRMSAALDAQMGSEQWQRGEQYIPHPSTWLNGERWEDELAPPAGGLPRETETVGSELPSW